MADDFNIADLPKEAQDYIRELRQEAGKYRTERNDWKTKYEDAGSALAEANDKFKDLEKIQSDFESAQREVSQLTEKNERTTAWLTGLGIDNEADRLRGSKYEEWEADAKSLAERIANKPPGVKKDPAAAEPPKTPKDDPITKAFRDAGVF